jgi:hypothetical protein
MLKPIKQMRERVDIGRTESDTTYFSDLMLLGELTIKLIVAGFVAALKDGRERHNYAARYNLVRADSIGRWVQVLDDALIGVASQQLVAEAMSDRRDLTHRVGPGSWQYDSAEAMHRCLQVIGAAADDMPAKADGRLWMQKFVQLRNKTRGHGAVPSHLSGELASSFEPGVTAVLNGCAVLQREWVYARRNLSGKYRISQISDQAASFYPLKSRSDVSMRDGVYIWYGSPHFVGAVDSDPDLMDFFLANGGFNPRTFEMLSYATGNTSTGDAAEYSTPIGPLPESETHGLGELDIFGQSFGNLPSEAVGYVSRQEIEHELQSALASLEQRPVVTLRGSGGVGKTSLALHLAHALSHTGRFQLILWFSARDIDLLPGGPKPVTPRAITVDDVCAQFTSLVLPNLSEAKAAELQALFARHLSKSDDTHYGSKLLIFDNFETVSSPHDFYRWLDAHVRLPNKVLITTRFRDFKGDYPIEVRGMDELEYIQLVKTEAERLGIASLLTRAYIDELYTESAGHPYVVKILLGEVAQSKRLGKVQRILAGSDDILVALFERTYNKLHPAAQRTFLTLSQWRSNVPVIGLEAVLLQAFEERVNVSDIVTDLENFSLVEVNHSSDGEEFVSVPLVAAKFGQQKIGTSPLKEKIFSDVALLHEFGATQTGEIKRGFGPRLDRFCKFVAKSVFDGKADLARYVPMLEVIARRQPLGWVRLADLYEERGADGDLERAKECLRLYLGTAEEGSSLRVWERLARLCRHTQDYQGEVHALVELSTMPDVPFSKITYTANRLNTISWRGDLDSEELRHLMRRFADVMKRRRTEADADDLSRFAWVYLQIGEHVDARLCVSDGLRVDAGNVHCLKLAERLSA